MPTRSINLTAPSPLVQGYFPALDGLRAIAFCLVFGIHLCLPVWDVKFFRWGWVGVDLFFVLSGFLITGILYDSLDRSGYFSTFYKRRALRIFPLFYGFWLLLLLFTPILHLVWNPYIIAMAGYIGNFFTPGALEGLHASPVVIFFSTRHLPEVPHSISFGHFWSLCVEEQFYLAWPAVIWLIRKRIALLRLCLAVVVAMPVVRLWVAVHHPVLAQSFGIYSSTLLRSDTLLLGAAVALWLRGPSLPTERIRRFAYAALSGALLLIVLFYTREATHPEVRFYDFFIETFGFSLIAIAAAAILILAIDGESPLQPLLRHRSLSSLGRISYGLYFYHALPQSQFLYAIERLKPLHLAYLVPIMGFVWSWGVATLSFRLIEMPFLRLKTRIAPPPKRADQMTTRVLRHRPNGAWISPRPKPR